MSHAPLDIQKSKLVVMVVQSFSKGKTYFCLIFSIKFNKTSFEKFFGMEAALKDINASKATLTRHFQQLY